MGGKKPKIALNLLRAQQKAEKHTRGKDEESAKKKKKIPAPKHTKSGLSHTDGSNASILRKRGTSGETLSQSSSIIGIDFKDRGNFYHLRHKASKYSYEHKLRNKHDPFCNVDVATDCETFFIGQKVRSHQTKTEHFAYIVDLDNYEYHKVVFHSFLNEILQSSFFRYGILCLVMINSVLIGLATLPQLKPLEVIFTLLDMVILSVFIFEVIIKWIYDFRLFWTVYWNCLDFFIISLTVMSAVVPLADQGDHAAISVKVVRTFRSLRCVSSFTSLSIVTHTVFKSGLDMGNILLVLIIIMLVLSVMAVILFDIEDLAPQRFLNALDAWVVLFICVTQDGWAEVLNSYERSSRYFVILALYLIFAVSVGAFVFANLIVAVIVANLELSVKELREEMKIHDNPLEFHASYLSGDVEIIPVYDLLAKDNFVCISQRPLKIPRLKKLTTKRIQVYVSLIVALEQNMLEAEIIALDLEKIIAVILSIIVQIDVNTGNIAKKERKEALEKLEKLADMIEKAKQKGNSKGAGDAGPVFEPPPPQPEPTEISPEETIPQDQDGNLQTVRFPSQTNELIGLQDLKQGKKKDGRNISFADLKEGKN